MKKLNNNGMIGLLELAAIVLVVGLLGFTVYGFTSENSVANETEDAQQNQIIRTDNESVEEDSNVGELYDFDQLGIAMQVAEGWTVSTDHFSTDQYAGEGNFEDYYKWTVEKSNTEGHIIISSLPFQGGFAGCSNPDTLTEVTILDSKATKNKDLHMLHYATGGSFEIISIVRSDEEKFANSNQPDAARIPNADLTVGTSYHCEDEGLPGFNLGLFTEHSGGIEQVEAALSEFNGDKNVSLEINDEVLEEIKSMLVTIQ